MTDQWLITSFSNNNADFIFMFGIKASVLKSLFINFSKTEDHSLYIYDEVV